jgi:hypothetical protein
MDFGKKYGDARVKWEDQRITDHYLSENSISYRLRIDQYKVTIQGYLKTHNRNPKRMLNQSRRECLDLGGLILNQAIEKSTQEACPTNA